MDGDHTFPTPSEERQRREFLGSGHQEIEWLLESIRSSFDLEAAQRIVRGWIRLGHGLGFDRISRQAAVLEGLLKKQLSGMVGLGLRGAPVRLQDPVPLRQGLEEMSRLFAEASQDGGPPPDAEGVTRAPSSEPSLFTSVSSGDQPPVREEASCQQTPERSELAEKARRIADLEEALRNRDRQIEELISDLEIVQRRISILVRELREHREMASRIKQELLEREERIRRILETD